MRNLTLNKLYKAHDALNDAYSNLSTAFWAITNSKCVMNKDNKQAIINAQHEIDFAMQDLCAMIECEEEKLKKTGKSK